VCGHAIGVLVTGKSVSNILDTNVIAVCDGFAIIVGVATRSALGRDLLFQAVAVDRREGTTIVGHVILVAARVVGHIGAGLTHEVDTDRILAVALAHLGVITEWAFGPGLGTTEGIGETAITKLTADSMVAVPGDALLVLVADDSISLLR